MKKQYIHPHFSILRQGRNDKENLGATTVVTVTPVTQGIILILLL